MSSGPFITDTIEPLAIFLAELEIQTATNTAATISETTVDPIDSNDFDVVLQCNQLVSTMQSIYRYCPSDSTQWIASIGSSTSQPDFDAKVMWNTYDLFTNPNVSNPPSHDSAYIFASSSFRFIDTLELDATSSTATRDGENVTNFGSNVPLYRAFITPVNSNLFPGDPILNTPPEVDFINQLAIAVFGAGTGSASLFGNETAVKDSYENAVFKSMINIAGEFTFNERAGSPTGTSGAVGGVGGDNSGAVDTGTQTVDSVGNTSYDPSEADPNITDRNQIYNGLASAFSVYNQLLTEPSRFELMRCVQSFDTSADTDNSINGFYAPIATGDLGSGELYYQTSSANFQNVYGYNGNINTNAYYNVNTNTSAQNYSQFTGGPITFDSNINSTGYAFLAGQTISIPSESVTVGNSEKGSVSGIAFQALFSTNYTPADTAASTDESYSTVPQLVSLGTTGTNSGIDITDTIVIDLDSNCTTNIEPPGYDQTNKGPYRFLDSTVFQPDATAGYQSVGRITVQPINELLNAFNGSTTDFYPMPFVDGDIVQTVFTITSAPGQQDASGNVIGSSVQRKVLMQCVLKSDESQFITGNYEFSQA